MPIDDENPKIEQMKIEKTERLPNANNERELMKKINSLEKKRDAVTAKLSRVDLSSDQINALYLELRDINLEIEQKTEEWLEATA